MICPKGNFRLIGKIGSYYHRKVTYKTQYTFVKLLKATEISWPDTMSNIGQEMSLGVTYESQNNYELGQNPQILV